MLAVPAVGERFRHLAGALRRAARADHHHRAGRVDHRDRRSELAGLPIDASRDPGGRVLGAHPRLSHVVGVLRRRPGSWPSTRSAAVAPAAGRAWRWPRTAGRTTSCLLGIVVVAAGSQEGRSGTRFDHLTIGAGVGARRRPRHLPARRRGTSGGCLRLGAIRFRALGRGASPWQPCRSAGLWRLLQLVPLDRAARRDALDRGSGAAARPCPPSCCGQTPGVHMPVRPVSSVGVASPPHRPAVALLTLGLCAQRGRLRGARRPARGRRLGADPRRRRRRRGGRQHVRVRREGQAGLDRHAAGRGRHRRQGRRDRLPGPAVRA